MGLFIATVFTLGVIFCLACMKPVRRRIRLGSFLCTISPPMGSQSLTFFASPAGSPASGGSARQDDLQQEDGAAVRGCSSVRVVPAAVAVKGAWEAAAAAGGCANPGESEPGQGPGPGAAQSLSAERGAGGGLTGEARAEGGGASSAQRKRRKSSMMTFQYVSVTAPVAASPPSCRYWRPSHRWFRPGRHGGECRQGVSLAGCVSGGRVLFLSSCFLSRLHAGGGERTGSGGGGWCSVRCIRSGGRRTYIRGGSKGRAGEEMPASAASAKSASCSRCDMPPAPAPARGRERRGVADEMRGRGGEGRSRAACFIVDDNKDFCVRTWRHDDNGTHGTCATGAGGRACCAGVVAEESR